MPLLQFCLVHLCDALIRHSPNDPDASEVVKFCLGVLDQCRPGFAVCGPLQELIRRTAVECGVAIPSEVQDLVAALGPIDMDSILDACTRLSYTQPMDQILPHIDPSIGQYWNDEWRTFIVERHGQTRKPPSSGRYLQIGNILND